MKGTKLKPVARTEPCVICGGTHKCSRGQDGLILCGRQSGPVAGFVHLGQANGDPQFALYRRAADPLVLRHQAEANGHHEDRGFTWSAKAKELAGNLTPELRNELAQMLGLPEAVTAAIPIGYVKQGPHRDPETKQSLGPAWTFAETNAAGQIVGITCRYADGTKRAWPGCMRGLTVPDGWKKIDGPLLLPEGASCTLALTALGLAAVGRPSNLGGVDELAELLRDVPATRPIIALGEWDANPKGQWPGRDGAVHLSAELTRRLSRPVRWVLPPSGVKDIRAWVLAQNLDPTCGDAWTTSGEYLLCDLEKAALDPAKEPELKGNGRAGGDDGALATTCLASIKPLPIHWLVPRYLPLGKLVLIAGDGGNGKSALTLRLAADITRGRPCLGQQYDAGEPGEVLLIACEDDYADTVVPRLMAADADLTRVHRVDGVRKAGKLLPFNLNFFHEMEALLHARPGIRLVVIDPAGAYIGRSGVDDYKDAELRSLLDPMAELAARCRTTILLVKHLNKGATAKAVHKVAGSTGYVNAVRAAFLVAPDADDETKKLLLPLKFNLGRKPEGLAYRLRSLDAPERATVLQALEHLQPDDKDTLGEQLFRVEWEGQVTTDADQLMAASDKRDRGPNKVQQAAKWLEQFLAEYAYPNEEIIQAGQSAGFTRDNLWRAKSLLGDKIRASNRGAYQGRWHWGPGAPVGWRLRPHPSHAPDLPETTEYPDLPETDWPDPFSGVSGKSYMSGDAGGHDLPRPEFGE